MERRANFILFPSGCATFGKTNKTDIRQVQVLKATGGGRDDHLPQLSSAQSVASDDAENVRSAFELNLIEQLSLELQIEHDGRTARVHSGRARIPVGSRNEFGRNFVLFAFAFVRLCELHSSSPAAGS